MARQYHSWISRKWQLYTETCFNLSQLARNLPYILGSVYEELELALEDELAFDKHGAIISIVDACY